MPAVRSGGDPEGVHRLRVALARLDVWLMLGGWRVLRSDVRWLRHQAAAVRDLDVGLAQSPPTAVARRLLAQRADAQRAMLVAIDSPRARSLMSALATLPRPSRVASRRVVATLAVKAQERGRRATERPHDLAAIHALRRAVRRLRFALEWTGRGCKALVALHEALGRIGDRVAALKAFKGLRQPPSRARAWRRTLQHALRTKTRRAMTLWRRAAPTLKDLH